MWLIREATPLPVLDPNPHAFTSSSAAQLYNLHFHCFYVASLASSSPASFNLFCFLTFDFLQGADGWCVWAAAAVNLVQNHRTGSTVMKCFLIIIIIIILIIIVITIIAIKVPTRLTAAVLLCTDRINNLRWAESMQLISG